MYCFSCYLALYLEKYLQYSIDITTEQSFKYMEFIDAKIWISESASLCRAFANQVTIINKHVAVMYQFKSARMVSVMLRLICVFLGCDMSIQLVLSSQYDDWKMEDRLSFTHFSTCNLPMQLLLCVNKRLTTSIIKY